MAKNSHMTWNIQSECYNLTLLHEKLFMISASSRFENLAFVLTWSIERSRFAKFSDKIVPLAWKKLTDEPCCLVRVKIEFRRKGDGWKRKTIISGSFEIANLKISQPLLNNSVSQLISILDIGAEGGGNFRQKLKLFWLAAKAKNVYRWCFFHEGTMFENKWFRTGTDWSLDVSNFFRRQKFEFERFVKSAKSIKGRSRLPLFGDRTILFLIPSVTSSDQISMSC